jgi:hypothetical protein
MILTPTVVISAALQSDWLLLTYLYNSRRCITASTPEWQDCHFIFNVIDLCCSYKPVSACDGIFFFLTLHNVKHDLEQVVFEL